MFSPTRRAFTLTLALGLAVAATPGIADDKKEEKKMELQVGDAAPAFDARTDRDTTWESSGRYGKKWVVIYFYPGDFTPGCTAQANAFRDAMNKLTEQGVEVVGVSGDSVQTHELFHKAQKLNFTLLSDEAGSIAKKFGVPFGPGATVNAKDADGNPIVVKRAGTAARWTFIVGKDGKIAYKNTKVTPADDAKKIAEFIMKAEQK
jgi:peroxiredoxin Q/BCP